MSEETNPLERFYRQGYSKESGKIFKDGKTREIKFVSLVELIKAVESRAEKGHVTYSCDDPKRLLLGVMDETADDWLFITLTHLKQSKDLMSEAEAEFIKSCLQTSNGKDLLFKRN